MSGIGEALIVVFMNNANKFYQIRFGFSQIQAGQLIMIPYTVCAVLTPLMGRWIQKIGKRGKSHISRLTFTNDLSAVFTGAFDVASDS
jgi:hypothetical protein